MAFGHILVAVDFGESSGQALDVAVQLAQEFGARLTLVHAYEVPAFSYDGAPFLAAEEVFAPIEAAARAELQKTLDAVRARVPAAEGSLRLGPAAGEILAAVDESKPDLVVVGTHGRHGLGRALLGSVAEKVVRLSPVPVLSVRRRA